MIKLYTFPPSTNSRKVRIALLEKGLEFERINVDLSKREQKSTEYLSIHPFGQVPALDDEGFVIYDSTVINEYLEDEYPYPPLMPKDSEGRARARLMEDFRDNHFNGYFVHIIQEIRKPEGERDTWPALSVSPISLSCPTSTCSIVLALPSIRNTKTRSPGSRASKRGPALPLRRHNWRDDRAPNLRLVSPPLQRTWGSHR